MKKIFLKLALLVTLTVSFLGTSIANAEEDSAIATNLEKIQNNLVDSTNCIDETERNEYIITTIEEPIITGGQTEETPEEGFITRTCYRVTIIYEHSAKDADRVVSGFKRECPSITENSEYPKTTLYCKRVQVLLSKGGTSLISNYIGMIYRWAASIVGLLAVIVIVISGMQIALAGGDGQAVDEAKGRIGKSIAGLAILFLASVILYTINPNFFTFS